MARTSPGALGGVALDRFRAELHPLGNCAAGLSVALSVLFLLLHVDLPKGRAPAGHIGLAAVLEAVSNAPRRRHVLLVGLGFPRARAQPRAADPLATEDCQGAWQ